MSIKDCPQCGGLMAFQDGEPDVGIVAGWECTVGGHTEIDEPSDEIDQ